jgi:hypothetical protein
MILEDIKMFQEEAELRPFEISYAGFKCDYCGEEVLVCQHAMKPHIRGVYCQCVRWVGRKEKAPKNRHEYRHMINKAIKEQGILK